MTTPTKALTMRPPINRLSNRNDTKTGTNSSWGPNPAACLAQIGSLGRGRGLARGSRSVLAVYVGDSSENTPLVAEVNVGNWLIQEQSG
jgi:hypothetical protein